MNAHTPGPWTNERDSLVVFFRESPYIIATVTDTRDGYANARLIAQAPAMLEALRMLVNLNRSKDPVEIGIVSDARAILAAVEGK